MQKIRYTRKEKKSLLISEQALDYKIHQSVLNSALKNIKEDYGIFFTTEWIVDFMVNLINIDRLSGKENIAILEPACGLAQFLIGIKRNHPFLFNKAKVFGVEINQEVIPHIVVGLGFREGGGVAAAYDEKCHPWMGDVYHLLRKSNLFNSNFNMSEQEVVEYLNSDYIKLYIRDTYREITYHLSLAQLKNLPLPDKKEWKKIKKEISDPIKDLQRFRDFLGSIPLNRYREELKDIKWVEQDLPKAILPLVSIFRYY